MRVDLPTTWYGTDESLDIEIDNINKELQFTIVSKNIFQKLYTSITGKEWSSTTFKTSQIADLLMADLPQELHNELEDFFDNPTILKPDNDRLITIFKQCTSPVIEEELKSKTPKGLVSVQTKIKNLLNEACQSLLDNNGKSTFSGELKILWSKVFDKFEGLNNEEYADKLDNLSGEILTRIHELYLEREVEIPSKVIDIVKELKIEASNLNLKETKTNSKKILEEQEFDRALSQPKGSSSLWGVIEGVPKTVYIDKQVIFHIEKLRSNIIYLIDLSIPHMSEKTILPKLLELRQKIRNEPENVDNDLLFKSLMMLANESQNLLFQYFERNKIEDPKINALYTDTLELSNKIKKEIDKSSIEYDVEKLDFLKDNLKELIRIVVTDKDFLLNMEGTEPPEISGKVEPSHIRIKLGGILEKLNDKKFLERLSNYQLGLTLADLSGDVFDILQPAFEKELIKETKEINKLAENIVITAQELGLADSSEEDSIST